MAIAACRASPDAPTSELFPDVDAELVRVALEERGVEVARVSWDDPGHAWSEDSAVLIRSTWDSVDRPREFVAWARSVAQHTNLVNPAPAVEATLDKRFLIGLEASGVALPATQFVPPGAEWRQPAKPFVVKPAISAGGRETALYDPSEPGEAAAHVARLHGRHMTAIVQEHVDAVSRRGEVKLVFIGGVYSHAIRSGPLLRLGAGVLDRPWEVETGADPIEPTLEELTFANRALESLQRLLAVYLTYARVDVVSRGRDDVVLMEIEAIDPSLSLWASRDAASRLADAVLETIG